MFKPMFVIIVCASSLLAQDITISKDSLWVYNSNVSSKADEVVFTSHSSSPINLDSAHIVVAEMDTAGLGLLPAGHGLEVAWNAGSSFYPYFTWTMDSIGAKEFVLKKENFLPPEALPLSFTKSGDIAQIFKMSIGLCFNCNSPPRYPAFFKGTLKLFFSDNPTIALRLYSDDLRKPSSSPRRGSITTLKMNTVLRSVKSISKGDDITISWMPVSGVIQCKLFDLNGRQLCAWQADGWLGETKAPVKVLRISPSTYILQVSVHNDTETGHDSYIIVMR